MLLPHSTSKGPAWVKDLKSFDCCFCALCLQLSTIVVTWRIMHKSIDYRYTECVLVWVATQQSVPLYLLNDAYH